jgi:hypothetical protein
MDNVFAEVVMKILQFNVRLDSVTAEWKKVNNVVINHAMTENDDMKKAWEMQGYEGIIDHVKEQLGIKMYRDTSGCITFEFTDKEWTMFLLRWS